MHRLDQRGDVLRWRELRDAVAQVEDVTGTRAERLDDAARLALDGLRRAEEGHGIEVSLQCHARAHAPPRVAQVRLPVDAERIRAAGRHGLEPEAAPLREEDARDDAPLALALQMPEHARGIGERELAIGLGCERAAPGV